MIKNMLAGMMVLFMVAIFTQAHAASGNHRIGVGANYWVALDDLDSDIDDDGFSYLVTYQFRAGLLGLQLDAEILPDRFGEDAYAPAAYLVLGGAIYAAAGAGIINQDDEWADDPFYAFKVGLDMELAPNVFLDIAGSYRFDSETDLDDAVDDIDTDTVFLGAALRMAF
jgi:opacity protein-like surface antigen